MAISDIAGRISRAADVGTETIEGLLKLRALSEASDLQKATLLQAGMKAEQDKALKVLEFQLNAAQKDMEIQGTALANFQKLYENNPDALSSPEYKKAESALLKNLSDSRKRYFTIAGTADLLPIGMSSLEMVQAVRGSMDEGDRKWTSNAFEIAEKLGFKVENPEEFEQLWKFADYAEGLEKKKGGESIASALTNALGEFEGAPVTSDESSAYFGDSPDLDKATLRNFLDTLTGAPLTDKGKAERAKEILEESLGAPAVKETTTTPKKETTATPKSAEVLQNLQLLEEMKNKGIFGESSADATDISLFEDALNLLVPSANAADFKNFGQEMFGQTSTPTGETSQLLSPESIAELRSMNRGFGGTGGVLSFAEGLRLSPKAEEFLRNLSVVSQELGEERARAYMTRELVKLSEADQEAVLNAIEELSQ